MHERGETWLRDLLPEADPLLALLPELGLPRNGTGNQARLFDAFGTLLRHLAAEHPVMFVVDSVRESSGS
jgi:hypothetical protein